MDVTTIITTLGGVELIKKVLGPSFDYIGNNLKLYTEKMHRNLAAIFKKADKKLGDRINDAGSVSPKVIKSILENGAWCEEELQAEYFGGVLASSRNDCPRDDRGAYYSGIITSLTAYQIRLHYLIYMEIRRLFVGQQLNIGEASDRGRMEVFIPFKTYLDAMAFSASEMKSFVSIMQHSVWGLHNASLVDSFRYGPKESLEKHFPGIKDDGGIILRPSQLGAELFLWAYGYGQSTANTLFDPSVVFNEVDSILLGKAYTKPEKTTLDVK